MVLFSRADAPESGASLIGSAAWDKAKSKFRETLGKNLAPNLWEKVTRVPVVGKVLGFITAGIPLSAMAEEEREQFVIGLIKFVTMPRNHKRLLVGENNRELDTAVISVADVIAYVNSYQRSLLESSDFKAYLEIMG